MSRLIRPVDSDWLEDGFAAPAIAVWESESGKHLPDDYRAFTLRYNGGKPYPNIFMHTALHSDGADNPSESFVEPFYAWDRVVAWSAELGNRLPSDCLVIGADPGLLEIVLSLRDDDHGAVYSWVRNWGVWGSEENSYLCPQAASFDDFVASLFDNEAKDGYDHWHMPRHDRITRELKS